jgi:hypothetical protein
MLWLCLSGTRRLVQVAKGQGVVYPLFLQWLRQGQLAGLSSGLGAPGDDPGGFKHRTRWRLWLARIGFDMIDVVGFLQKCFLQDGTEGRTAGAILGCWSKSVSKG